MAAYLVDSAESSEHLVLWPEAILKKTITKFYRANAWSKKQSFLPYREVGESTTPSSAHLTTILFRLLVLLGRDRHCARFHSRDPLQCIAHTIFAPLAILWKRALGCTYSIAINDGPLQNPKTGIYKSNLYCNFHGCFMRALNATRILNVYVRCLYNNTSQ